MEGYDKHTVSTRNKNILTDIGTCQRIRIFKPSNYYREGSSAKENQNTNARFVNSFWEAEQCT